MVDDGRVHGAQHAIRQRGRSGNLQEMAAYGTGRVLCHQLVLATCDDLKRGRGWKMALSLVRIKDQCDIRSRPASTAGHVIRTVWYTFNMGRPHHRGSCL